MASTAAHADERRHVTADGEVSLARLYVLRATYLLLIIGLGAMIVPEILNHELTSRGVIPALLGAVWVLAFVGIKHPLGMLPLLMFEFVWKAIWMVAYGVPQWSAGQLPPTFAGHVQHRFRRDPDAARHSVGVRVAPLCAAAVGALELSRCCPASSRAKPATGSKDTAPRCGCSGCCCS